MFPLFCVFFVLCCFCVVCIILKKYKNLNFPFSFNEQYVPIKTICIVFAHRQLNGSHGEYTCSDDVICKFFLVICFLLFFVYPFYKCFPLIFFIFEVVISVYFYFINLCVMSLFSLVFIFIFRRRHFFPYNFLFITLLLHLSYSFFILISQLNGSHGEVTNSDDVKGKTFGRRRGQPDRNVEPEIFTERKPGVQKKEREEVKNEEIVEEKTEIVVKPEEPIYLEVPGFTYGVNSYPPVSGYFLPSIIERLNKEIPTISSETRSQLAVRGWLRSKYPNLSDSSVLLGTYQHIFRNRSACIIDDRQQLAIFHANNIPLLTVDPVRLVDKVSTTKVMDWDYNNKWKVIGKKGFNFIWDKNMKVRKYPCFETQLQEGRKKYVTMSSFQGYQPFVWYDNNAHNACNALSRYFAARPDESVLNENQQRLCSVVPDEDMVVVTEACNSVFSNGVEGKEVNTRNGTSLRILPCHEAYHSLFQHISNKFSDKFFIISTILGILWTFSKSALYTVAKNVYDYNYRYYDFFTWLNDLVSLPAVKRDMYVKWASDIRISWKIFVNDVVFQSKVKDEIARYDSYPRLYATAEHGCLVDKIAPEIVKNMCKYSIPFHEIYPNRFGNEFYCVFKDCQEVEASDVMFTHTSAASCSYAVYFSDDGFIRIVVNGIEYLFETDISKCDMSNRLAIFSWCFCLLKNVCGVEMAKRLVQQCAQATTLYNPENRAEYVRLLPETFFEFSGSVITTLLNNLANIVIFFAIYLALCDNGFIVTPEVIIDAAKSVGYVLTVKECPSMACATFLKRSFDGQRSFLCLGTLLRSFGHIDGYTPEIFGLEPNVFFSKTKRELFEIYGKNRVSGLVNEPGNIILSALRKRFNVKDSSSFTPTVALCERYSCCEYELEELSGYLLNLNLGDSVCCPALCKIFLVDYGVPVSKGITFGEFEQIELDPKLDARVVYQNGLSSISQERKNSLSSISYKEKTSLSSISSKEMVNKKE